MGYTALITGASSGIGREIAHIHAWRGGDLVVVARREGALLELKRELEEQHRVSVMVLPMDLSVPDAAERIYERTREAKIEVDYLINNAGFGGHGRFHERDWETDRAMIQVNITALTGLTHMYLKEMVERGSGKVLNVASSAGFLPGPLQAVYYATKSYVVSFSQAIAEELAETGVTVTALCPGPVDTEFMEAADLEGVSFFEKQAVTPRKVAQIGYEAMLKGRLIAFDQKRLRLLMDYVVPLIPRKLLLRISRMTMEKQTG